MLALLLSIAGSTALHLDDASAIAPEDVRNVETALVQALESAGRTRVVRDDDRARCAGEPACVLGIANRAETEQVVIWSLSGGASKNLLIAEAWISGERSARAEMLLPVDALVTELELLLRGLVVELSLRPDPDRPPIDAAITVAQPSVSPATWILLASAIAATAAGVAVGSIAIGDRAELGSALMVRDREVDARIERIERLEIAAAVLLPIGIMLGAFASLSDLLW